MTGNRPRNEEIRELSGAFNAMMNAEEKLHQVLFPEEKEETNGRENETGAD